MHRLPKPHSCFVSINQSIFALHNRAGRFTAFCCLFSQWEMPIWAIECSRKTPLTSALLLNQHQLQFLQTHSQNTNSVPDCVCHLYTYIQLNQSCGTKPNPTNNTTHFRVPREILTWSAASDLFETHCSITWHCSENQAFFKNTFFSFLSFCNTL